VLIEWAQREQGLVMAPGNPLGIHELADLQKTKARVIERQEGEWSLPERLGRIDTVANLIGSGARDEPGFGLHVPSGVGVGRHR
ncbi:MAG: molybdenum ABC transporter substrate-binding protein, partial [Chloroflexi bacterium]|nr:molybdenum ABC transporter substrate-binding protein [Chloroflexota bacterium]